MEIFNKDVNILGNLTLSLDNAVGNIVTINGVGVASYRTAAQILSDIGYAPQTLSIVGSTITLSDTGGSVTVPSYNDTAVVNHMTSTGSDHSYINQNVTTFATPTFVNVFSNTEATANSHLVRLDQMNSAISGLDWQESILDQINFTTSEPISPSTGDRYINTTTGVGSTTTSTAFVIDRIYEWDFNQGGIWIEFIPNEGWTAWNEYIDTNLTFNGVSWVEFGSTVSHNNTTGLQGGTSGEYYHLSSSDYSGLTSGGDTSLHTHTFASLTSRPTTIAGYGITDGIVTTDARLSDARTATLTGNLLTAVPSGAVFTDTVYTHPSGDGNLHVIATSTTNNGKVLTAGATAGSLTWTDKTVNTDTVYTHPTTSGNKHIPSGGSAGQFLKYSASGTAVWAADNNTTYDLSGYLLNTTDTFTGELTVTGGGIKTLNADSDQTASADSSSLPDTTGAEFLRIGSSGTYSDGRYTHEWAKVDRSGNLSLYLRESKGTANAFSNIVRFGSHAYNSETLEVFGTIGATNLSGTNTGDQDLSTYALSADYLPLVGGTLTGALTGTSATFASSVSADGIIYTKDSLRFNGTNLNATDKKLYSPADGVLEWMTHSGASQKGFAISHQGTKAVYLNISGNSYLNGGNVGIGTTSPDSKLQVNNIGEGEFAGSDSTAAGSSHLMLREEGGTSRTLMSGPSIVFQTPANADGTNIWATSRLLGSPAAAGSARGTFSIQVRDAYDPLGNGTTWNWRTALTAINNGNVGIGTDSPVYKFVVSNGTQTGAFNPNSSGFMFLGSTSNHPLYLGVNDSTKMVLLDNGNVGIGTNGPTNGKLVIDSTGFQTSLETGTAGDGRLNIGHFSNGTFIGTYGDDGGVADLIRFGTHSGDERMRITSGGNVGIGTNDPNAKLEIKHGVQSGLTLPLIINPGFHQTGTSSGIGFLTDGNASYTKGALVYTTNGSGWNIGDFQFLLRNDGNQNLVTLADAKMTIKASGYVGIGTDIPNEKLDVRGKVYIESQGVDWNETTPGLTRGALHFDPAGSGANNTGNAITFGASDSSFGTNANAGIYTRSDGTYGSKMYFATTDSYALGSKTRMMIDYNGNVGIGTTSPLARTHIVGPTLATGSESTYGLAVSDIGDQTKTLILGYDLVNDVGIIQAIDQQTAWKNLAFAISGNTSVGIGTSTFATGEKLAISDGTTQLGIYPGYKDNVATANWVTLEIPGSGGLRVWDELSVSGAVSASNLSGTNTGDQDLSVLAERSAISYGSSLLQWTDVSGNGGTGLNGAAPGNPTNDWYHHIVMNHANGAGYYFDLACPFHTDNVYFRRNHAGTLTSWRKVWTDGNLTNVSQLTNDAGYTGDQTNISGNAATANEAQNNYFYVRGISPSILFDDTDQAQTRYVHHNGGAIGFLTAGGAWSLRCADGSSEFYGSVKATNGNFTDKLTVTGTGTGGVPTLDVINTSVSTFMHSAEFMTAGMTTAQTNLLMIGKSSNTKNSGWIGYRYIAAASDDNTLSFGHWGADHLMNIKGNGYVGIGTTSPGYKLDVSGTGYYSGQLTIDGFTNNSGISFRKGFSPTNTGIRAKAVATANRDGLELLGYNGIDFTVNNGANVAMRIVGVTGSGMGNVGIGTTSPSYKLDVNGTIRATGDVIAYSDVRVKKNINTIENAVDTVNKLRGVTYQKIDNDEYGIGVIAQELEKVLPHLVKTDEKGMKAVAYGNITGVLIEAIKEQDIKMSEQDIKISEQDDRIRRLEALVEQMLNNK